MIYRLRPSNKNTINELEANYLWFSKPRYFNDTQDSNILSFAKNDSSILNLINTVFGGSSEVVAFLNSVGICCFTNRKPNSNSWTHFPKCRNGILVEYDKELLEKHFIKCYGLGDCFKKIEYLRNPIIFDSSRPNDILWRQEDGYNIYKTLNDIANNSRDMDKFFLKMFTRLNYKHHRQKEERIILKEEFLRNDEFALKQGYKIPIDKKAILKVYYSSRTPNETINQLKKLGIPLEKTNRNAG
jgi:hypothetical protein